MKYIQRFGSLFRGGALQCAWKLSDSITTAQRKTFWKINIKFYRKQDCNLLKDVTTKGSKNVILLRIWFCVRTCQNGHATPMNSCYRCAYIDKDHSFRKSGNQFSAKCKVYFAGLQIRDNLGDLRYRLVLHMNISRVSAADYLSVKNNLKNLLLCCSILNFL